MPPSFVRSSMDIKRACLLSHAPSQRLRANSVQDPSQISGSLLQRAASAAATAAPVLPTTSKLPANPREHMQIPSSLPSSRRSSRADLADNWRTKVQVSHERGDSMSRGNSADPGPLKADVTTKKQSKVVTVAKVEVLPPLRVSMDPTPVEVLPPLRFSMDPPVKGRSAWRFVLPSPPSQNDNDQKSDGEGEEYPNDLPKWFDGTESDFIVSLGSEIVRSDSPSGLSSSSTSTLSDSPSLGAETPPLDRGNDLAETFSQPSSRSSSPALSEAQLPALAKSDSASFHFAMPMLSAAAPLPSKLPMPSFLRAPRRVA